MNDPIIGNFLNYLDLFEHQLRASYGVHKPIGSITIDYDLWPYLLKELEVHFKYTTMKIDFTEFDLYGIKIRRGEPL